MLEWLQGHQTLVWFLVTLSVFVLVGTLIGLPIIVVRMRADYFVREKPPPGSWQRQRPALRWTLLVLKNILGLLFVIVGLATSIPLVPGQGILTLLIGIGLLDVPGKRRLEIWIVRLPAVLRTINWMRAKANRPPLEVPPRE